jgi:glycosyl transferase, family 25
MMMKHSLSIKVINAEHRNDRRMECIREFDSIGMTPEEYSFFNAKYISDSGARGCALSHAKAISDFLFDERKPFLLIFEDDFTIREKGSFLPSVQEILQHKDLWDVFLLAHNCAISVAPTPMANTKQVINSQTASGYIVGRLYAAKLIECFFRSAELLAASEEIPSPNKEYAASIFCCDMLWKELQIKDTFWARVPSLTHQRASYSDIEKRYADYKV